MGSEISFYVSVFLRRFHYFALVAAVISAAGIATAFLLPTRYYTEALLLVEPPQIPQDLASSTVQQPAEEQLQILQQKLMTRANLIDVSNDVGVFEHSESIHPDDVAAMMRSATTFRISTGRDRASLFTIGFEADKPGVAAAVVNDYITRVLENNTDIRLGSAEDTKKFFDDQLTSLSADLAEKNAEILRFNQANADALPQNFGYNMSRLDNARNRINSIDREITSLGQQRERLILVFNATGGTNGRTSTLSPERQELAKLRSELAKAVTIYSEQNPRLNSLRTRIAQLESLIGSQEGAERTAPEGDVPVTMLDVQLDQVDTQIEGLKKERTEVEADIERLEDILDRTPQNQIALDTLTQDRDNIQNQYNQTVERASKAATGERIELLSKGQRITVVNPPVVPREPSSPNRPLIAVGGILAGIAMGIAAVAALEFLNRSIRRPVDITRALGIVPIATLPVMRTPGEITRRRAIMAGVIMASTAGIVAGIVFLHTQVMPLDLMVDLAVQRLGG